jgi:plastocyanin
MMQKHITPIITKAWLYLFTVGLVLTLAACGGAPSTTPTPTPTTASSSGNSVSIMNFSFSPNSLTVKVGTKVTWTNHDSVTHTVTANQGTLNSPVPPGSSFSFTFTKAGTYAYHCSIHPSMTATIIVQ